MNSLKIKQFGVQELDAKEMISIDGGVRWGSKTIVEKVVDFITSLFKEEISQLVSHSFFRKRIFRLVGIFYFNQF